MPILVIGAGSLGLLLAAKLSDKVQEVDLMTRTVEQSEAIQRDGIAVLRQSSLHAHPRRVFSFYDPIDAIGEYDAVLVTVKQTQLTTSLLQTASLLAGKKGLVVLLQNGIGHVEKAMSIIPTNRIRVGVVKEGAKRLSNTTIEHTGSGGIQFGPWDSLHVEQLFYEVDHRLATWLSDAGFIVAFEPRIIKAVWEKLIMNAVINPLTAIYQLRNGDLPGSKERLELMHQLFNEGFLLAERVGVILPSDLWDRTLELCQLTANNYSSMLQDLQAGRPTEIESINGTMLQMANSVGLSLDTHQTVYELVSSLEKATLAK